MANLTKQERAVAAGNQLIALAAQFRFLRAQCLEFKQENVSEGYPTTWGAMATATVAADGSISATPDGSPNLANPITVQGLNRSRNQLNSMVLLIDDFVNFLNNGAVVASNRSPVLDDLIS